MKANRCVSRYNMPIGEYQKQLIDAERQATVEDEFVRHGRWSRTTVISKKAGYGVQYCYHAECKINPCRLFESMTDYCPCCGAKMDLEVIL